MRDGEVRSACENSGQEQTIVHLRLMQTADIHAHILSYDYITDRAWNRTGLAGLARLIQKARREVPQNCLFDTGDFLQGSPLADLFAETGCDSQPEVHPVIAAMNALAYDAGTLGNHDFNYGLEFVTRTIEKARFPVICANVALKLAKSPCDDATFVPPWTILTRQVLDQRGQAHDLRIGVIGLLPPQIEIWDRRTIAGHVQTRDMVDTAAAYLPQMRAAGADLVVALAHSGIAADDGRGRAENAALALAALPGIDAIFCAHQHRLFPGPGWDGIADVDGQAGTLHGKPAVMAGFWGSHLGLIDLECQRSGDGWRVTGHRSQLRARPDHAPSGPQGADDPQIARLIDTAHQRTRRHLQQVIGAVTRPVQSFFARVADDPAAQLIAAAQYHAVAKALANRPEGALPLLSAAAAFKVGGAAGPENFTRIAAGPVRLRDIADLYPYPNRLCAVQVTGAALRVWLEQVAAQFHQILPDMADQPLLDPAFACYNFDVICGLRYVIDLSQPLRFGADGQLRDPTAWRIRDLTWRGQPVHDDQPFVVATNSYRGDGGSAITAMRQMRNIPLPCDQRLTGVLRDYLSQAGRVETAAQPVWRFAPLRGASVWFDSAPDAIKHLPHVTGHRITCTGTAPEGFARFRLSL